jgi:hypothetical protein
MSLGFDFILVDVDDINSYEPLKLGHFIMAIFVASLDMFELCLCTTYTVNEFSESIVIVHLIHLRYWFAFSRVQPS